MGLKSITRKGGPGDVQGPGRPGLPSDKLLLDRNENPALQENKCKGLIRGPNLEIFIPFSKRISMEEALAKADAEKRVIASNTRLDRTLAEGEGWVGIHKAIPCWTGTMTAYEEAGKPFGKFVEYVDNGIRYVFPVPDEYVGAKDCLLVAEHPDFILETNGNDRIVRAGRIDLIERFPAERGWYLTNPEHGIPFGEGIDESNPARRDLFRTKKMVGLIVRGCADWRGVLLSVRPSEVLGVAVESP